LFSSSWHKREGVSRRVGGGLITVLVAGSLLLTGCSEFVDRDQLHAEPGAELTLEPGHPVGQTFVARHAGLGGVEIWLEPGQGSQEEIRLHLRSDPQAEEDLATTTLPLTQVTAPAFYRFTFSTLPGSHGNYYYAFLEMVEEGTVLVGGGPGEAYLDGALYRDHLPLDAQMAFRLVYEPLWILLDLGWAAVGALGLLGVAGLLYVVPGWALLAWLWRGERLLWAERLGVAAGLSLALYPLLLLWTDLVGLHLGPLYAWLPMVGGLVALIWRYRDWRPRRGLEALRQWAWSEALWPDLALLAVVGLVFGVRLLVVRTLDAPMWGDSYHHTMIAQLLVDNGGLFDSWEPYVPYRGLTTHFGFPAAAAVFSWGAGVESHQAVLVAGQLINGLAVLTLYPLAVRIADGNRWAGVGAVLVAGLLSPLPARYVNWGRYAQLAGQAILPVALWLLWEAARRDRLVWRTTGLAGIVLSGMTLVYYRMPFYYAIFVLAWLVGWGLPNWRTNGRRWLVGLARLALVGGIALLLVLPWVLHVAGSSLARVVGTRVAMDALLEHVLADYQVWRDVAPFVPQPLIISALVALLWSLARQRWTVASVGLWVMGLASLVACSLIRLPGAKMMQNYAIVIALYIPVGLLVGWLVGQIAMLVVQWAGGARRRWIMGAAIVSMAVWAALGQMRIVQPSYVMVTRPDVRAMAWIRENTPPEARFLVEGFRIYGGYSTVGADAGWWIPLLAGRENTMPPQYALVNEVPVESGYTQRVVGLVAHLETASPASPEGMRLLCDWGITHVYVGQGQGKVGNHAVQLFSPDALTASSVFNEVYQQDRVHVFALNPVVCGVNGR
jgi:hypothetical protein